MRWELRLRMTINTPKPATTIAKINPITMPAIWPASKPPAKDVENCWYTECTIHLHNHSEKVSRILTAIELILKNFLINTFVVILNLKIYFLCKAPHNAVKSLTVKRN